MAAITSKSDKALTETSILFKALPGKAVASFNEGQSAMAVKNLLDWVLTKGAGMEGFDSVDKEKIDNKQLISLYLKVTEKFPNDSKALEILGVLYNVAGDRQAASEVAPTEPSAAVANPRVTLALVAPRGGRQRSATAQRARLFAARMPRPPSACRPCSSPS